MSPSSSIPMPPKFGMAEPELLASGRPDQLESVRGELRSPAPLGWERGRIVSNVGSLFHARVRAKNLGEVIGGEVGIYTGRK